MENKNKAKLIGAVGAAALAIFGVTNDTVKKAASKATGFNVAVSTENSSGNKTLSGKAVSLDGATIGSGFSGQIGNNETTENSGGN